MEQPEPHAGEQRALETDHRCRPDYEVAIIGAGLSGIGMAIALRRAGIDDVIVLERAGAIGGTWRDNTYPGVGVDVPSQSYQFSYALKPDWSRIFAKGHEVLDYIEDCADRFDVRRHVRLNSEVRARRWDEQAQLWRLEVGDEEITGRFVISAIGCFVDPKPAAIPGVDDFRGPVLRSAAWDHDVDLTDKRVAIVGTGASAVQIIPEIAGSVSRLDVYQRTPIWVGPKLDAMMPRAAQALFRRAPAIQEPVRAASTRTMEAVLVNLAVHHDRVSPVTRAAGWVARNVWYRAQVRDPDVRRRLTPDYEIGCKRPAVSNSYLRAFNRQNVELVTDPIDRVLPGGIRTIEGDEREVDVLILATGFRVSTDPENFRRTPVRGRDDFDLATFYAENRAQSYESVSMPGLPNHFMIFGPYGWTGGTWHVLVETASRHIVRVIEEARLRGTPEVEVRPEAAERWTRFAVDRLSRSVWQQGDCSTANSYYVDPHGDATFLRPTSARQARRAARTFPLEDYEFRDPTKTDAREDLGTVVAP
ncbi:MAG: flavin-containing monooxygenase [Solirubrobacteraceae bacterium]